MASPWIDLVFTFNIMIRLSEKALQIRALSLQGKLEKKEHSAVCLLRQSGGRGEAGRSTGQPSRKCVEQDRDEETRQFPQLH